MTARLLPTEETTQLLQLCIYSTLFGEACSLQWKQRSFQSVIPSSDIKQRAFRMEESNLDLDAKRSTTVANEKDARTG